MVKFVSNVFVVVMFRFIDNIIIIESMLLFVLVSGLFRFLSVSVFMVVNCIELKVLKIFNCMICSYIGMLGVIMVKLVIIRLIMIVLIESMC